MARTRTRQEFQIRKSDTYDDKIVPSEINYEIDTVSGEDDLNAVRSAVNSLLNNQLGNWWDGLNVPSSFEGGVARGVNDLNTDLHELERKRILKLVAGARIIVPSAIRATQILRFHSNVFENDTVAIGSIVYTYKLVLTHSDWEVLIGVNTLESIYNLIYAINNTDGHPGKFQVPNAHPNVSVNIGVGNTMIASAIIYGTAGNTITTIASFVDLLSQWDGTTLVGGRGDLVVIDDVNDLPSNKVIAIGNVITIGTVCAYNATFESVSLDKVDSGNSLVPKNLCRIVNSYTNVPLYDSNWHEIYALFQSESNVDGSTLSIVSPNRAQLSFVVRNATNDNFEVVNGYYIGGHHIDYFPIERYPLDDIPEHKWLDELAIESSNKLPSATEVGQFLYSWNGSTFNIVKPVVSDDGFILTDDDGNIVVTET